MAAKHRLLAALGVLLQLVLSASTGRAEQASKLKVSFVLVFDVIEPRAIKGHHSGFSATLTLSGRNEVGEDWQKANISGQGQYHSAQSELGKTWRVLSANAIQGTWRVRNYTKTVTVRVTGKTCSVTFDTQLDSGETYYKTPVGGVIFSHTKPKMIDPVCTVEG
jgi:hypothetical protein